MGSRRYTGRRGPKILASFLNARHFGIKVVLLSTLSGSLLVTSSPSAHAQPPVPPTLNALPRNYQLPLSGGLGGGVDVLPEQYRAKTSVPTPKRRRTIPTLRARYRPQDGDLFGEGQANPSDSPEGSIFDELEKGPQPPATKRPAQSNPFGEPNQENPFDEPEEERTPFDPSPREPLMDTQLDQPKPRAKKRTSGQSLGSEQPQLPDGSEYTPDSRSIPELPMPDGSTRSTEKAGSDTDERGDSSILIVPEEDISDELQQLKDELDNLDLVDPRDRSPRSDQSSRRRRATISEQEDFRRRQTGSNVYRPAREPSYYSRPTDYGSRAYGQLPPGYDPNSPHASYPNVAPKDMEMIVQSAVQYAMRNYAANPANPAVAPYYGCGYACPPCPPGLQAPPSPNCGCGPQGVRAFPTDPAAMLSQQFTQPASSSCSPSVTNEVYEGVVCGDQEIESPQAGCYPRKASGLSIGGLGLGAIRNYGPNVYYGSIFGGWVGLDDLMLSGDEGQIQISNDGGFAGGFAFGKIQGKNLRSELEVTYRGNDLNAMTLNDLTGSTQLFEGEGKIDTVSGMLNVIWDFTDLPSRSFTPYLGAGFGGISANADFQIDGQSTLGDGNDTSLAYQWIAGVNFKTKSLSDLYVEYRYFAADSLHFNTTLPASAIIDGDGELEYRTSNVLFGLRMKF